MKVQLSIILGVFLISFFLVSCAQESGETSSGAAENSGGTVEAVASSVETAGDVAADWTRQAGYWMSDTWETIKATSAEGSARVAENVDEATQLMGRQIEIAQKKASELTGKAKEQAEQGIEGLKKARAEIAAAGSRLSTATAERWPEIKKELAEAWGQAGHSMEEIWQATTGSVDESGD